MLSFSNVILCLRSALQCYSHRKIFRYISHPNYLCWARRHVPYFKEACKETTTSECSKNRMYRHLQFQELHNLRILTCLNADVLILTTDCNHVVPTCIIWGKLRDSVELYTETYLSRPWIFQVPKLDMSITNCDKIVPIFSKWYRFHLGRHFVRSNLHIRTPVPHIHYHVMLWTNRHNIFVVWGESLKHTFTLLENVLMLIRVLMEVL